MTRGLKVLALFVTVFAVTLCYSDTFQVTASAPGIQTPASGLAYESFAGQTAGQSGNGFTTTFGNSDYQATYSGALVWTAASQYGGAGGGGIYAAVVSGNSYTIDLTPRNGAPAANYFGLWISALDAGNRIQIYNGNTLLLDLASTALISALAGNAAYNGNPNNGYMLHADPSQQFAYFNFLDLTGGFTRIVITEGMACGNGCGFETDNQSVGYVAVTPEPATLVLFGPALGALALLRRRLFRR